MSIIGLLSLICALMSGVCAVDASSAWTWGNALFVTSFSIAAAAFVGSSLRRPSLLWEVIDDLRGHRLQNSHAHESRQPT